MKVAKIFQSSSNADKSDRQGRGAWCPGWMLLLLAAFFLAGLTAIFHFRLAYDEATYLQTLRMQDRGFLLYREIFYSQFPPFLGSARITYELGGRTAEAARLATLLYACLGLIAVFWIGRLMERRLGTKYSSLYLPLLASTDVLYFGLSYRLLGDASSTALCLWAFAFALKAREARRPWVWMICSGVAAACGVLLKGIVLPLFLPLGILWLNLGFLPAVAAGASALVMGLGTLLASGYFALGGLGQLQGGTAQGGAEIASTFPLHLKLLTFFSHSGGGQVHGNLLLPVLSLASLYFLRRDARFRPLVRLLVVSLVVIGLVFCVHKNINWYHFVIFFPLLNLPLALWAEQGVWPRRTVGALVAANLLVLGATFLFNDLQPPERRNARVAAWLKQCTKPDSQVIADTLLPVVQADRPSPPALTDLSGARVHFRSVTCDSLTPYLKDPKVEAFVSTLSFPLLDCGEDEWQRRVEAEFPFRAVYEKKSKLFLRKPCPPPGTGPAQTPE